MEFKAELLEEIVERIVSMYKDVLQKFLKLEKVKNKEKYFPYYANELDKRLKKILHLDT